MQTRVDGHQLIAVFGTSGHFNSVHGGCFCASESEKMPFLWGFPVPRWGGELRAGGGEAFQLLYPLTPVVEPSGVWKVLVEENRVEKVAVLHGFSFGTMPLRRTDPHLLTETDPPRDFIKSHSGMRVRAVEVMVAAAQQGSDVAPSCLG